MPRLRTPVRHMPKIYGNMQKPARSSGSFFRYFKIILVVGVVGGFVYVIVFSSVFSIRNVTVEGVQFSSQKKIIDTVPQGTNIFRFAKEPSLAAILSDTTIQTASIYKGIPNTIKIEIKEREPVLRWVSGTTISVIDPVGVPFLQYDTQQLPNPQSKIGQSLAVVPQVVDTKSVPITVDRQVVSESFVTFIQQVNTELLSNMPEVSLDHFEISESTSDITYISKSGLRVVFNTLSDPGVQVRNLTRLIHQKKATLQSHIDLRIDRWAYVSP